jgi:L-asparaginase / beta-aspartyl-peptidase
MLRLILHGGAGRIDVARTAAYRAGLRAALDAGWRVLEAGGDAVEAVVCAVATMEADPAAFNAGVGGSPTSAGTVECDACLVRGRDGAAGAVALLTRSRTPIRVAERVLRTSPHVLIAGPAADALVADPVENEALLTPYTRERLARWREREEEPMGSATVGALARDAGGDLAAATSTGGRLGQWPGRIGDTPIVGAGTYADAHVAVSATGKGEAFMRAVTAKAYAERIAAGVPAAAAIAGALADVRAMEGSGGLIVLDRDGLLAYGFDTSAMAVAWRARDAAGAREEVEVHRVPGVRLPLEGLAARLPPEAG